MLLVSVNCICLWRVMEQGEVAKSELLGTLFLKDGAYADQAFVSSALARGIVQL